MTQRAPSTKTPSTTSRCATPEKHPKAPQGEVQPRGEGLPQVGEGTHPGVGRQPASGSGLRRRAGNDQI